MRVAVFANQGDGDDGYVGERLLDHGADLRHYIREDLRSLEHLNHEVDLIVIAQAADIPILGICFGGQQISNALGLKVSASVVPEIGWKMVTSRDESQIASGPWFQYHFDRWSDGDEVSSVAVSPGGP